MDQKDWNKAMDGAASGPFTPQRALTIRALLGIAQANKINATRHKKFAEWCSNNAEALLMWAAAPAEKEKNYTVRWEIDATAPSAYDAAKNTWTRVLRREWPPEPDSACCFTVVSYDTGVEHDVDLEKDRRP